MKLLLTTAALAMTVCAAGCRATSCEELVAEPMEGEYRGGASLGDVRLLGVSLEASSQQVVLSFSAPDGTTLRATYRVLKKTRHDAVSRPAR